MPLPHRLSHGPSPRRKSRHHSQRKSPPLSLLILKPSLTHLSQLIKAGEGIIASNQSANRDDDVFPDPDTFDMHRKRGSEQALGFGFGEHQCVADWLARAELEIVFGKSPPVPREGPV